MKNRKAAKRNAAHPLDGLLPLIEAEGRELHLHATVLEVAEMNQLAELASQPKIRRYLLCRLSDTAALVEPGCTRELEDTLTALQHTPKRLHGDWQ
ncbi:MAG TPA: hypothetical protein VGM05_23470 [Planctomycetaceae bacterium]|jgi:hypothetical protein